jgi:hypothetical protein
VEDLMPIDATQAALIGAGIGAAATTAGSMLTALVALSVARKNSYAQHLYVKRAEVYEDLLREMATWMDKSFEERQEQQLDVTIRLSLYGAADVSRAHHDAVQALERFEAIQRHDEGFEGRTIEWEELLAMDDYDLRVEKARQAWGARFDHLLWVTTWDSQRTPTRRTFRSLPQLIKSMLREKMSGQ